MPTSSLFKQFVVYGDKSIEKFINALENSCKNPRTNNSVNYRNVTDKDEIRKLIGIKESITDSTEK